MQLFSQLQSFIYFDNSNINQLSNSFGRVYEFEDYARVVNGNSSEAAYSNMNSTRDANPISSFKNDARTKETNLLDSNKLDSNKVENLHIFLYYRKTTVNSYQFYWGS